MAEEKLPCDRHTEQIKTLFKKVDDMNYVENFMHNLDKSMALQTQLLETVVEHNKKQDKRMDEQQEVIISINSNLTELNEGQKVLNSRVGKLEEKVEENEEKNTIDLRDVRKKKVSDFLYKYAMPIILLSWIFDIIKNYFIK